MKYQALFACVFLAPCVALAQQGTFSGRAAELLGGHRTPVRVKPPAVLTVKNIEKYLGEQQQLLRAAQRGRPSRLAKSPVSYDVKRKRFTYRTIQNKKAEVKRLESLLGTLPQIHRYAHQAGQIGSLTGPRTRFTIEEIDTEKAFIIQYTPHGGWNFWLVGPIVKTFQKGPLLAMRNGRPAERQIPGAFRITGQQAGPARYSKGLFDVVEPYNLAPHYKKLGIARKEKDKKKTAPRTRSKPREK